MYGVLRISLLRRFSIQDSESQAMGPHKDDLPGGPNMPGGPGGPQSPGLPGIPGNPGFPGGPRLP